MSFFSFTGYCFAQTETIVKYYKSIAYQETRDSMACREETTPFTDNTCQNVTHEWDNSGWWFGETKKEDILFLAVQECRCGTEHCAGEADMKKTQEVVEKSLNAWKEQRKREGHVDNIVVIDPNDNSTLPEEEEEETTVKTGSVGAQFSPWSLFGLVLDVAAVFLILG
jgi:hypothetical protein